MASFELREPKKKPRYYKLIANVLVNGKIERRYGRFDFDPTELKNARARNAAAKAAAAEFERLEQEKADKEASNAGKTFAVVAQEYIASNRSRMAPSVRLKGDYDSNRNKENTSLKKEKYLQRIQCYPEFSEKPIALITKKDCDSMIRFIEDSDARVYKRAVLKPEAKEFKTVSCPKIAKECTIREETIERIFRGETVSLDSAQQVATALGKTVEQMFEVEIDRRPMTKKTMREYNLFIRSVLNYANDNYGTSLQMPMIKASGRKGKSVDCLHSDEVEALQAALQECSMLEKAIVLCLLNTGVRRGELAGLTWKDVNFREGTIHVSKSLLVFPNYGYQLTTTKESNIRDVDVAPEFMDFLKDYYAQWKAQKKLMGASWQKNLEKKGSKYAQSLLDLRGNDFVICNDYGFPINPDSYGALVRRVGKKAGIEKIHPHMFRHPYVKHTTKIFSLRLMDFQAQAYPDARRKTRGACQLHRGGQSRSPVRPLCNRKRFSYLPPQAKMSWILYAISMRLSGYTSTRSISSSASSMVSVSASKIALDASLRLSCRVCSSCFCFACANTAA